MFQARSPSLSLPLYNPLLLYPSSSTHTHVRTCPIADSRHSVLCSHRLYCGTTIRQFNTYEEDANYTLGVICSKPPIYVEHLSNAESYVRTLQSKVVISIQDLLHNMCTCMHLYADWSRSQRLMHSRCACTFQLLLCQMTL